MNSVESRARRVAALFDELAPTYETVIPWFRPIAERLVDEVDPHHREHVLDVGCGTGAAIPALAEAVGPHGRVVGVDLSRRMLDRAKTVVGIRDLHMVELYEMDAADPDLPDASFSAVVASLVLTFLPDPAAALRRWFDLLVPMGKLGVTTFAERSAAWVEVDQLFLPYLMDTTGDPRAPAAAASTGSDDRVADLMHAAGFQDVRTTRFELPVTFGSPLEWRDWTMSVGQRAWWAMVPDEQRDDLYRRAADVLQRAAGPARPIQLSQTVRITIGYRSSYLRPPGL